MTEPQGSLMPRDQLRLLRRTAIDLERTAAERNQARRQIHGQEQLLVARLDGLMATIRAALDGLRAEAATVEAVVETLSSIGAYLIEFHEEVRDIPDEVYQEPEQDPTTCKHEPDEHSRTIRGRCRKCGSTIELVTVVLPDGDQDVWMTPEQARHHDEDE